MRDGCRRRSRSAWTCLRNWASPSPLRTGCLAELDQRFENLLRWLDATEPDDDLARPELTDPTMLAGSRVIDAIQPAAYFGQEPLLMAWLSLQALRIWREHGPARPLVGAATGIPVAAVALRNNYALPYRALRRLLALSEARGYEPESSHATFPFSAAGVVVRAARDSVDEARQAREGLIGGGDLGQRGIHLCHRLCGLCSTARRHWTPASPSSTRVWPLCDASAA